MNKYISKMGVVFTALVTLTACDLDTAPTTSLDADNTFKSTTCADDVLRGTWSYVFNDGITIQSVGLGAILLNDDFMGSDCVKAKSYGFSDGYNLTAGYARAQHVRFCWTMCYDAINNSNNVIAYVDNASGTQADKKRIKGQAYATRGFMYMMLASHYSFAIDKDPNAVCVPVYTQPTTLGTALSGNPASSVSEVYAQAVSDLKKAVELIPSDYSHGSAQADQYKIDYTAALGLLARTCLYARQWEDAYTYASQVLERNSYLMTEAEYKEGFNDYNNKEWLWAYTSTLDDCDGATVGWFKCNSLNGYGSLCVDPNFAAKFSEGDYRGDLFKQWGYTLQGGQTIRLMNDKFKMVDEDNDLTNYALMRTSEIYLIKAEAAAHINNKEGEARELLHDLQQARMKAGATAPAVTATGNDLLEAIWMERRKELWGEGFALTDIIRNQKSVEREAHDVEGVTVYPKNDTSKDPVAQDPENPIIGEGHYTLKLPDGSAFTKNSIYYLYRILADEELQNQNLYTKYPKLSEYR